MGVASPLNNRPFPSAQNQGNQAMFQAALVIHMTDNQVKPGYVL